MRTDARRILLAAVDAVDAGKLVRDHLSANPGLFGELNVWLAAVGKAAAPMAVAASEVLGPTLVSGVVIVPDYSIPDLPPNLQMFRGGHPIPSEEGFRGARAVRELAAGLGDDDVLLCLVSGGASALMTCPWETVNLEDLQAITDALLQAGAPIDELNCVRKHLDRLKGGRLASCAHPTTVYALILSDVVGDALDVIASGPVSPDPTRFADAVQILEKRRLWAGAPASVRAHLQEGVSGQVPETPKPGDSCFAGVTTRILGNNRLALEGAAQAASEFGYRVVLRDAPLVGEAREVGRELAVWAAGARTVGERICLIAGGETTVTVRGSGRGGRNQEIVLAAAIEIAGRVPMVIASLATDGVDGPTDAAGAIADPSTLGRAAAEGCSAADALRANDSYRFFAALDDLILTGPTGTNTMDVQVALIEE